jgi:hypothetical protein
MDTDKLFQSKIFKKVVLGIIILVIFLSVFKMGMVVGARKAEFSNRWSDNYHRNFGGPRNGFLSGFNDRDFIGASGTFGEIIKADRGTLVVKGQGDVEKIILIKDNTVIKRFSDTMKLTDIKIGDYAVVIGESNDAGQIEANLVRLLPLQSKDMTIKSFAPQSR